MRSWAQIRSALAFRAARRLGRSQVTVNGRWGHIRGYTDDLAMLAHYGYHGTWSAGTVALLAQTARKITACGRPAPLLVDVGAAIGLVSIGVLRQAPGRALAIESFPDNCSLLEHNVARNHMNDRIEVAQLAIGAPGADKRGVRMTRTPGNGGDCWIVAESADGSGTPLVSIDALTAQHPDVPLLVKVDVQGYEPQVLAGGTDTFERARLTVIEFWPYGIRRMGHDPEAFIHCLLNGKRRVALMYDEHRAQPGHWMSAETATAELARIIADGRPEQQVEIIFEGAC